MSQHVAGSRLTSNIKITLKITFTLEIFADITRTLAVLLLHLKFCKKILILMFFLDLFSVEYKFFCPNSAENTMENRAISLVESSRDNSLIACPTSSGKQCVLWTRDRRCFPRRSRGKHRRSRVHKTHCFPEVSANKCFIIYQ